MNHRRRPALLIPMAAAAAMALAAGPIPSVADSGASSPSEGGGPRRNVYGDPFIAVTHGMPGCPVPEGPLLTEAEANAEAHWRSQRGASCYLSGRCRLSNAYLYDKEIIPRVEKAIRADGRYDNTSVWVLGQRRWVYLKGCVASAEQAGNLERLVRNIDDVEIVIDELSVGAATKPKYAVERSSEAAPPR